MAVELMGAKLVAPFYGGSLYVWTAVLTITVLGLTLGYYAGGRLSKKRPSERVLFSILGISALLVLALPLTASISMDLTRGLGLIIGICITCFLLLLPPMLCFGIVGPLVVRLPYPRRRTQIVCHCHGLITGCIACHLHRENAAEQKMQAGIIDPGYS